jgi:hypothetical protein
MRPDFTRFGSLARGVSAALRLAPLALLALVAASPAQAQREDQGLQLGCANDYFRLCAGVDPNSDYDRRSGGGSQSRGQR